MPIAHIDNASLFFREVGDGLPCVVMHGGLGFDHTYLHPWLDTLANTFRLVYYDHRGNGRSGRPPLATLTLEQLVQDAEALRCHLGLSKSQSSGIVTAALLPWNTLFGIRNTSAICCL